MKTLPIQSARLGLALVILATLGLSACGRRGPLELPPDAAPSAKPASASAASKLAPNGGGQNEAPAVTPPKTPFFLDPLL